MPSRTKAGWDAAATESSANIAKAQANLQSQIKSFAAQERVRAALMHYADDMGLKLSTLPSVAGPARPVDMPAYRESSPNVACYPMIETPGDGGRTCLHRRE